MINASTSETREGGKKMYAPLVEGEHPTFPSGIQMIYRFSNGYGASVVRFPGSYTDGDDEWEVAVLKFSSEDPMSTDGPLCYDTEVTDDVIGHVYKDDLDTILDAIAGLNEAGNYRGKVIPEYIRTKRASK